MYYYYYYAHVARALEIPRSYKSILLKGLFPSLLSSGIKIRKCRFRIIYFTVRLILSFGFNDLSGIALLIMQFGGTSGRLALPLTRYYIVSFYLLRTNSNRSYSASTIFIQCNFPTQQ